MTPCDRILDYQGTTHIKDAFYGSDFPTSQKVEILPNFYDMFKTSWKRKICDEFSWMSVGMRQSWKERYVTKERQAA